MFGPDRNLLAWNQHYEEVLQFPEGILVEGRSNRELAYAIAQRGDYGEGDPGEIADARIAYLWGGEAIRSDMVFRNDRTYDVMTQRTQNGGLVITYTDITDRKQAEEEIETQRDELEKLNNQKDKFFSIIAHDLKSPFTTLLGFSQMIAESGENYSRKQLEEWAQSVHESGQQVFDLLENLLEWSLLQRNEITFSPRELDLKSLVSNNLALLEPTAKAKNILIDDKKVPPVKVFGDPYMVNAVLRNLISNAIKFTDAHGAISLAARENGNIVHVSVIDDGIGIPPEKVKRLFLLGEKTSTLGTNGEMGTGLGLDLCKELVERQGGELTVESVVGEGSTFRFTLPVTAEQPHTTQLI